MLMTLAWTLMEIIRSRAKASKSFITLALSVSLVAPSRIKVSAMKTWVSRWSSISQWLTIFHLAYAITITTFRLSLSRTSHPRMLIINRITSTALSYCSIRARVKLLIRLLSRRSLLKMNTRSMMKKMSIILSNSITTMIRPMNSTTLSIMIALTKQLILTQTHLKTLKYLQMVLRTLLLKLLSSDL